MLMMQINEKWTNKNTLSKTKKIVYRNRLGKMMTPNGLSVHRCQMIRYRGSTYCAIDKFFTNK